LTLAFPSSDSSDEEDAEPIIINTKEVPLSSFNYGYCTTNHKFQGAEIDNLIFYLPVYNFFVSWKHVYTAFTRARSKVIAITTDKVLFDSVMNKGSKKRCKLGEHLKDGKILDKLSSKNDQNKAYLRELCDKMMESDDQEGSPQEVSFNMKENTSSTEKKRKTTDSTTKKSNKTPRGNAQKR
jgi:hypothetical protein